MTDLVKKETNAVATYEPQGEAVLKSDIVIPKVLLMQGLSDFVAERKAIAGDMVRSNNAEKLGDDKKPVKIIPIMFQNLWMLSEEIQGKYEFRRYEPRVAKNEMDPWEYIENGAKWKRTKVMNLFALLPQDIDAQEKMMKEFEETGEMPDIDKVLLPVVIPFRNTSFKAGKEVATLFAKAESISRQVGKPVPAYGTTMELSCIQEKNDKGTFFVYKATTSGKTEAKYREAAQTWYNTLTQGLANIKIDETEDKAEEKASSGPTNF